MARAVTLTGDKRINAMLAKLKGPQAKKIIRESARPALKAILPSAKRNVPTRSGALRKAIKVRAIRRSRKRVGMRLTIGDQNFTGKTFYGGFQEWGWKTGSRKSQNRRQIEGKAFLKKAAEDNQEFAVGIYRNEIMKRLEALARGA